MAFDAGELVATIRAGGVQAFEGDMNRAEARFRALAATATAQGAANEAASRRAVAALQAQAAAADRAGQRSTQGASAQRAAAEAAAAAARRLEAANRAAGDAGAQGGSRTSQAQRDARAAIDAAAAAERAQTTAAREAARAQQEAGRAARAAAQQAAAAAQEQKAAIDRVKAASTEMGRSLTVAGGSALAAFAGAAVSASDLESRLAQLRTLGQYGEASMQRAGEAALTAGTQYGLTANEVADAQIELQKANIGLTQQLGGALPGALTLAAAGQMDVAEATSIAVTAMTQFQKTGKDVPHIADLLAAGADRALGSVGDLGAALKQGGLVASQYGWSIEDTTATLSAFANAGLVGSDAGTSLKTMLLSLATPTQQQAKLMSQLGISAYDASGHFVTSAELAGQLQGKLGGLDEASRNSALGILFGSDAVRAANVLYLEGQSGIEGWTKTVDESGFAAQQAAGKQDSLRGDAMKLAAAFQNDLIRAGESVTPVLRGVAQATTGVLSVVQGVPQPVLAGATALTALGGAAAVGLGGLLLLAPKVMEGAQTMRVLRQEAALATYGTGRLSSAARVGASAVGGLRGAASGAASVLGGPWGIALAVAAAGAIAYGTAVNNAKASTETLEAAASQGAAGIDVLSAAASRGQNVQQGWVGILGGQALDGFTSEARVFDDLTAKLENLNNAHLPSWLRGIGDTDAAALQETLQQIGTSLGSLADEDAPKAAQAFEALSEKYRLTADQQAVVLSYMQPYQAALETTATKQGLLTGKETDAQRSKILLGVASKQAASAGEDQASTALQQAAAIGEIQGSAAAASQDVSKLAQDIKGLGSAQLDARSANRALEQAVDDAATAFGKNGHSLDINTQKGRDNQAALDAIAGAATSAASATYAQTGSVEKAASKMRDARGEFVQMAAKVLGSAAAAEKLADKLGLIPENVASLVSVNGVPAAQAKIQALRDSLLNIPDGEANIYVNAVASGVDASRARQIAVNATKGGNYAGGGAVQGPGTPGVDSIIAAVAPGEHMWTHQEVQAVGGQGAMYRMRAAAKSGAFAGAFASGGAIGDSSSSRRKAEEDAVKQQEIIRRLKSQLTLANRAQKRADKTYQDAQSDQASIYGKGTGDKKHEAVLRTREAAADAKSAAADVKALQKRLDNAQGSLADARAAVTEQTGRGQALTQSRDDLQFQVQRGQLVDPTNPLGAVDALISASRDTNLSAKQRASLLGTAKTQNGNLQGLSSRQTAANTDLDASTAKLDDAKQAYAEAVKAFTDVKDPVQETKTALDAANQAYDDAVKSFDTSITPLQASKDALDTASSAYDSFVSAITDRTTDYDRAKAGLTDAQNALDSAIQSFTTVRTPVTEASDALTGAQEAATKAQGALTQLRGTFDSLVASVSQNVRSVFSLGNAVQDGGTQESSLSHNAGTAAQWDEKVSQTSDSTVTLAGIRGQIDQSAASITGFADQLQALADKGFSSSVIQDVEQLGTEKGAQVADVLLTATNEERDAINRGYVAMTASSDRAGQTVAQAVLGQPLAEAQRAADAADQQVVLAQQTLDQSKADMLALLTQNRDNAAAQLAVTQQATLDQLQAAKDGAQQVYDGEKQSTLDTLASQKADAQRAYDQAKADALAQLQSAQADAQKAYDAAVRNRDAINAQITTAQQAIVDGISKALTGMNADGSKPTTATGTKSLQQQLTEQYAAIQAGYANVGKRADGGLHDAQMAPAGANILWAEAETGGESYIPHSPAKRARSLSILQATASRFGQVVLPMADGAYRGGSSSSTDARSFGGDTYVFQGNWMGRPEDAMRAARREADARKARAVANAGLGRIVP